MSLAQMNAQNGLIQNASKHEVQPNWGMTIEGAQLSLAFEKSAFTSGEPIEAVITLANVSERGLTFGTLSHHLELEFTIADSSGNTLPKAPFGRGRDFIDSPRRITLMPQEHSEFRVRLDTVWKLQPNVTYLVEVERTISKLDESGSSVLKSGTARFHVTDDDTNTAGLNRTNLPSTMHDHRSPIVRPVAATEQRSVAALTTGASPKTDTAGFSAAQMDPALVTTAKHSHYVWMAGTALGLAGVLAGAFLLLRHQRKASAPPPRAAPAPPPPSGSWR